MRKIITLSFLSIYLGLGYITTSVYAHTGAVPPKLNFDWLSMLGYLLLIVGGVSALMLVLMLIIKRRS